MEHTPNQLQAALLNMMKWFHAFCVRNGLCYYVLGGSMLGAARHQGFIPWDDDIDLGMPRSDYERLAALMEREAQGRFVLETPDTDATDFFYPFSKLYDTQTTLVENTKAKIRRGIYLDIFPLDGIGNTEAESRKHYRPVSWKQNLLLTRVGGVRKGRSFYKNAAVLAARMVPDWLLNNKKLLKNVVNSCKKYDFETCAWFGNLMGAWKQRELMPKTVLGTPTLYAFEDMQVYGAEQADMYLTYLYGDWRKLPPVEKRVSHHDFLELDLHRSYLERQTEVKA